MCGILTQSVHSEKIEMHKFMIRGANGKTIQPSDLGTLDNRREYRMTLFGILILGDDCAS